MPIQLSFIQGDGGPPGEPGAVGQDGEQVIGFYNL